MQKFSMMRSTWMEQMKKSLLFDLRLNRGGEVEPLHL